MCSTVMMNAQRFIVTLKHVLTTLIYYQTEEARMNWPIAAPKLKAVSHQRRRRRDTLNRFRHDFFKVQRKGQMGDAKLVFIPMILLFENKT